MGAISFNMAAPPFSKWVNIYVNRRQLSGTLPHLELSYTFIFEWCISSFCWAIFTVSDSN